MLIAERSCHANGFTTYLDGTFIMCPSGHDVRHLKLNICLTSLAGKGELFASSKQWFFHSCEIVATSLIVFVSDHISGCKGTS